MSSPSLQALPVELIHRILDHVDSETVFLSFRNVCRYFHTIVDSYDQHKLNFHAISKAGFQRIPRSIQPENVVSLTLSDDHRTAGQITSFLSLFNIHAFTRLRSITLIQVNNVDLTVFLEHASKCPLLSLSIEKRNYDDGIAQVKTLPLLMSCPIRYLALTQGTFFTDITNILIYFPCLQSLLLDGILWRENPQEPVNPIPVLSRLKSIVIHSRWPTLDTVISLLSCTPSLTHLKLTSFTAGFEFVWNGDWWIDFIRKSLPLLRSLEFYFNKRIHQSEDTYDIESIINSFRTPFWMEKQWCVTCDYDQTLRQLHLYTTPICQSIFIYRPSSKKISCSNFTKETSHLMDNVQSLIVHWPRDITIPYDRTALSNQPLFDRRVSKLTVIINENFSTNSIDYLSSLVNLSHVDTISLNLDLSQDSFIGIRPILEKFFDQIFSVQSIQFRSSRLEQLVDYLKIVRPIIPTQVKNITVDIVNGSGIDWILDQFQNFSSITFQGQGEYRSFSQQISDKLTKKIRVFTLHGSDAYASYWLENQRPNQ